MCIRDSPSPLPPPPPSAPGRPAPSRAARATHPLPRGARPSLRRAEVGAAVASRRRAPVAAAARRAAHAAWRARF
eukprot:3734152-Prymnesium_polylepis.1